MKKLATTLITIFFLYGFQNCVHAQSFDGKPLVVEITTDWCFACKLLKPTMEELKRQYSGQVTFITLNLTDEQTAREAEDLARQYGITEFFNNNRNAFPRVGIFCTSSLTPENNILGSANIETYKEALNKLVYNTTRTCNISGDFILADLGEGRPDEVQFGEIDGDRPDTPDFLDRPLEAIGSGRPPELTFWTYGQPIPLTYYNLLVLPKCSGNSQVICANATGTTNQTTDAPVFKPFDPNATRNEKGFNKIN